MSRLSHEALENNLAFRKQSNETPKIVQNTKQIDPKEIITSNSIFRPQKQPTVSHVIPSLIDSDPPDLDDTPSSKSTHKPPNLFLDDEDDQDDFNIFDDKLNSAKNANTESHQDRSHTAAASTSQIKSINLFADDEYDNFDDFLSNVTKVTAKLDHQKPESKVRNLFEDDDDDDVDDDKLFIQPSEPLQPAKQTPRTSILSNAPKKDVFLCNIFDDNPPDDDFETATTEHLRKSEASMPKQLSDTKAMESQPKKPSTLFSGSVNLFDDDDDDDDIFEKLIAPNSGKKDTSEADSKSEVYFDAGDSKPHENEEKTETLIAQPKNTTNLFSSDRLFDDIPPSDDEQLFSSTFSNKDTPKSKPSETLKQNTGEFYNDFSETVTSAPKFDDHVKDADTVKTSETVEPLKTVQSTKAAQTARKTNASECDEFKSSLSDDQLSAESKLNINDEHDGSQSEKRSEFLKKIDAFSNAKSMEAKPETAPMPKARQPKKLNLANIDINVAALLPNAKRAKSVEKSDSPNKGASDEINNDDLTPMSKGVIAKAVDQDNVDSAGRLTNLNRNRVKNASRRHPSTRAGRVQQYQKSIGNEEVDGTSEQTEKSPPKPEDNRNHIIPTSSFANRSEESQKEEIVERKMGGNENKAIAENIPPSPLKKNVAKLPFSKVISDEEIFENDSPSELLEDTDATINNSEISNQTKDESSSLDDQSSKNENPFSFLEEDQDEEKDEFMKAEEITPSKYTSTVPAKATPAYIDELPPELDVVDEKSGSKTNKGNSLLSQNALSLFGDDDDDDFDNDDIFANEKSNQSGT